MTALHQKAVEDFALNELSKNNTHQGSPRQEFFLGGFKFHVGFWTTILADGSGHPFMALTAWTPEGQRVLATGMFIYNNDPNIGMASPGEDLKNFMWLIGEQFTPPLIKYLEEKEVADEVMQVDDVDNDAVISFYEKVLALLPSVRFENGRLEFDREI